MWLQQLKSLQKNKKVAIFLITNFLHFIENNIGHFSTGVVPSTQVTTPKLTYLKPLVNLPTPGNEIKAKRAKSARGQIKFTVTFVSNHDEDVDLIWKDYKGGEVLIIEFLILQKISLIINY